MSLSDVPIVPTGPIDAALNPFSPDNLTSNHWHSPTTVDPDTSRSALSGPDDDRDDHYTFILNHGGKLLISAPEKSD